ncbi:MAG: tetratricopeptide repeat protein [Spirochaetes bacterium]|nr:tetratricopeptide repeat protein [Spirochaetota bacterium]
MKKSLFLLIILLLLNNLFSKERGLKVIIKNKSGEYESVSLYNKTHAVLIAIDDYSSEAGIPDLEYPVKDAEGMKEVLKNDFKFDTIVTLYNKKATKRNIEDTLFKLNVEFSKNDALLIFFAGHGYTKTAKDEKIGYIIPYDGSFDDTKMHKNLNMITLRDYISKELKPKHIFYIFDSCYSGTLFEKRGESEKARRDLEYLKEITAETVTMGFTAGTDEEQVLDGGPFGHSVFTGRIIEALKKTDDYITAKELITTVSKKVYYDAKDRGNKQSPQGGILYGQGDFVFIPNVIAKADMSKTAIERAKKELNEFEKMINKAKNEKDRKKEKELKAQKKALEEDITAKELIRERLEEDAKRRKIEKEEAKKNYNAAEEELAQLKLMLKQKQKELSASGRNIFTMLKEAKKLDKDIKDIKASFEKKRNNFTAKTNRYYDNQIKDAKKSPQGEFEKSDDYKIRINSEVAKINRRRKNDIAEYEAGIDQAKSEILTGMKKTLTEILDKTYPYPEDKYKVKIGKYNPDEEYYDVTVSFLIIKKDKDGKKYTKWIPYKVKWDIDIYNAKDIAGYRDYLITEVKSGIIYFDKKYTNEPNILVIKDPKKDKVVLENEFYRNKKKYMAMSEEKERKRKEEEKKKEEEKEELRRKYGLKIEADFQRGVAWYHKGEYDKAIEYYNKAIELDPNYTYAYYNRGSAWENKGEYDKAIKDYNKAIELDPNYTYAYHNRGIAWGKKGEYDKAIKDYNKAIELDPNYTSAYNSRGRAWYYKGKYDKAIKDFIKTEELDPNYPFAYFSELIVSFKISSQNYKSTLKKLNEKKDSFKSNEWSYTIANYLTGSISLKEFFAEVEEGETEKEKKERLCEACCYAGYSFLFTGEKGKAKKYFEKCVKTKTYNFIEYTLAKFELSQMK